MVTDFEWVKAEITDEDGSRCTRHYLIDPSGQIRADIDEPVGGLISFIADLYWGESRYSNWIYLSLAKSHCEQAYLAMLKCGPAKKRVKK